jgi:hypothetical protein
MRSHDAFHSLLGLKLLAPEEKPRSSLVRAGLMAGAILLAAVASACSSKSSANAGFTCKNPVATGSPDSTACAECGAAQCPSQQAAVESSCASLVSCIEACDCTGGSCESGCIAAASTQCQQLITTFGDCEKMAPACQAACG